MHIKYHDYIQYVSGYIVNQTDSGSYSGYYQCFYENPDNAVYCSYLGVDNVKTFDDAMLLLEEEHPIGSAQKIRVNNPNDPCQDCPRCRRQMWGSRTCRQSRLAFIIIASILLFTWAIVGSFVLCYSVLIRRMDSGVREIRDNNGTQLPAAASQAREPTSGPLTEPHFIQFATTYLSKRNFTDDEINLIIEDVLLDHRLPFTKRYDGIHDIEAHEKSTATSYAGWIRNAIDHHHKCVAITNVSTNVTQSVYQNIPSTDVLPSEI